MFSLRSEHLLGLLSCHLKPLQANKDGICEASQLFVSFIGMYNIRVFRIM